MSSDYVKFENITDWDHFQVSEEAFKKKHQPLLMNFISDVKNLKHDIHSHISFVEHVSKSRSANQHEILTNNKKLLHQCNHDKTIYQNEISRLLNENEKISESIDLIKERLRETESDKQILNEDRILFVEEVRNTYKSFMLAKEYYKEHLKMYYSIEGSPDSDEITVFVKFFRSKKSKSNNHSLTIVSNKNTKTHRLIETQPVLPMLEELQRRLKETGDLPGLLSCVRNCFCYMQSLST